MLYLAVNEGVGGAQRAGIFARNSGTENKTGVSVRGGMEDSDALVAVGEEALVFLARAMKDRDHPMARAELDVLRALEGGAQPDAALTIPSGVNRERLLLEMAVKEKVIRRCEAGYERTELGTRMLEALS